MMPRPKAGFAGAFLIKLAKHLALLASVMIVGGATGRGATSELAIFFLVATSAVLYSLGSGLERKSRRTAAFHLREP